MKEMYKLKYHLEPVSGWMNDPNGLVLGAASMIMDCYVISILVM